jgi:uncharacterized membrane protein
VDAGPYVYATRWITHLCAPIFVLLAGMAAGIVKERKGVKDLSSFLLSRGLWLIIIEMTVVSFGWKFNISNTPGVILQVIWAIGISMVFMSFLVRFGTKFNLILGILIIAGHNLIGPLLPESAFPAAEPWWVGIERRIFIEVAGVRAIVGYPFLAWLGIMAFGYGVSPVFNKTREERSVIFRNMSVLFITLFAGIRYLNIYGDPFPWEHGPDGLQTFLNFMDVQKYPPSLSYALITLGIGFMVLWIAEKSRMPLHDPVITIGKVPFFYYILHIYLIHGLSMLTGVIQGYDASEMTNPFRSYPEDFGFSLIVVYVVWIGVVLALYPACKWFAGVKARTGSRILSYL